MSADFAFLPRPPAAPVAEADPDPSTVDEGQHEHTPEACRPAARPGAGVPPAMTALPVGKAAGFLFLVQKQDFGPFTPN